MNTLYEWHIDVQRMNHYGDRVESRTPAVILAATRGEVTEKVRAAFGATYDSFRRFWSHRWVLREVREVPARPLSVRCPECHPLAEEASA